MTTLELSSEMGDFLASRIQGQQLRERMEPHLTSGQPLTIDFANVSMVMQPFLEASIGDLIRSRGPQIMRYLKFRNCNHESHAMLHLVVELSTSHWQDKR